jgi:hypothetical protein
MIEPKQIPVLLNGETVDIDRDIVNIVKAMNEFPGIRTVESCSGHGETPIAIFFIPETIDALPPLLYYFDACHSGVTWPASVYTDCSADHVMWVVESRNKGPQAYIEGNKIAECMLSDEMIIFEGVNDE